MSSSETPSSRPDFFKDGPGIEIRSLSATLSLAIMLALSGFRFGNPEGWAGGFLDTVLFGTFLSFIPVFTMLSTIESLKRIEALLKAQNAGNKNGP